MLYYPQLNSGAVSQLPVSHGTSIRTVSNQLAGGDTIRMGDPNDAFVRWQLQYSNVTDDEWASIEQLFEAAEGRLNTFTFVDPTGNLLMWSEDWTKPVWTADAMLQIGSGMQDPFGGSNAVELTNTSQTNQRIVQSIAAQSSFQYCFSLYLRSNVACDVQMVISASGQDSLSPIAVGPVWMRAVSSGRLSVSEDSIRFGVQLPSGARVHAFGAQVEAQPAPSQYKKTIDRGGVYSRTRFDSDSLILKTNAPNQNSGTVSLFSNLV